MDEPEHIEISKVRPGPIRHESLSPELLEQITAVFNVIGPYLNTTLEQFEVGFMRDMFPKSEVALWCRITAAWLAYHEKFVDGETLPNEDERRLLTALVVISAGINDPTQLGVPAEEGHRLLECYDGLSNE